MTPPTAILGGFTVALLIGAAGNVVFHRANSPDLGTQQGTTGGLTSGRNCTSATGRRDGPSSTFSSPVPAANVAGAVSVAQSSNGQENRTGSETEATGGRAGAAVLASIRAADVRFEPSPALLSAIRHCESAGSDVSTPNHAGALGPYQLLKPTWDDHAAGVPWAMAVDEPTARVVAGRYLAWIERTVSKWQGRPATLPQILGAWHSGVGNLRKCGYDVTRLGPEGRGFVRKVMTRMEANK